MFRHLSRRFVISVKALSIAASFFAERRGAPVRLRENLHRLDDGQCFRDVPETLLRAGLDGGNLVHYLHPLSMIASDTFMSTAG